MRSLNKSAMLLALLALLCAPPLAGPATAQDAPPLKIATLDLNAIRNNSLAIKSIREQIDKYRAGFEEDIKKEEDALKTANKELAKKRTLLGPEAFAKERRLFEQRVVGVQKLVRQRKLDLDKSFTKAMLEVEKKMNVIMADTATKRGATLVLRRQYTILADRSLDMTDEVLTRLNTEMKTVAVEKPGTK